MKEEWIIAYLNSDCSYEERETVENWIRASAENRKYFEELKLIWEHSRIDYSDYRPDLEKSWDRIARTISGKRRAVAYDSVQSIGKIWRIAASIVLLLGLGYLFMKYAGDRNVEAERISVQTGAEKALVDLPDGTTVWLNSNSTLHYPARFSRKGRQVSLTGEAYFEVIHDKHRTFSIDLGLSLVEVLGTSFNIDALAGGDEQVVTVATGKVSFRSSEDPSREIVLVAGEKGVFLSAENTYTREINRDLNYLAWKTGILVFENTALAEVCKDLSRYYQVHVNLARPENGQRRISVRYDNKELNEVLDILTMTLDLTYKVENGMYTIH